MLPNQSTRLLEFWSGHHFFEMLKDLKKEKHFDGIELQVNAKNVAAYEMYKKCGFTEKSINMELL